MPPELIAVVGTLGGAIVAGAIGYLANRSAKTREWKLALAKEQMGTRQRLYTEFLVEAQCLVVQAIHKKVSNAREFNSMNDKFAEISLLSSQAVVDAARIVADYAITTCTSDKTPEGKDFYARKQDFIDAARAEIASYHER